MMMMMMFTGDALIQVRSQVGITVYIVLWGGGAWLIGKTTNHRARFCDSFWDQMKNSNREMFKIMSISKNLRSIGSCKMKICDTKVPLPRVFIVDCVPSSVCQSFFFRAIFNWFVTYDVQLDVNSSCSRFGCSAPIWLHTIRKRCP